VNRILQSLQRRTILRLVLWRLGMLKPQTQTTNSERACIRRHAMGRSRLVEIGVFNGVTTLELRKAMAPDGKLWAVDPFYAGRLGFSVDEVISRSVVNRSSNGTVEFIKKTGTAAAEQLARESIDPIDFIFIDGDHSWAGIEGDWNGWSKLLASNGIASLHDSRSYVGRQVTLDSAKYMSKVIRHDAHFDVIEEADSITVLRRK
jgi:predicted O-methyltransferase YrrM